MVRHHYGAVNPFAHLNIVLVEEMYCKSKNLISFPTTATACLDLVDDVGDAVVEILALLGVRCSKERIAPGSLIEISLDSLFEMFRSFHNNLV